MKITRFFFVIVLLIIFKNGSVISITDAEIGRLMTQWGSVAEHN